MAIDPPNSTSTRSGDPCEAMKASTTTPTSPPPPGADTPLSDADLKAVQKFIFEAAGITLDNSKRMLISGRLSKRLRFHGLARFADYLKLIVRDDHERQVALDLLTTNETYFFREPQHFDFLRHEVIPNRRRGDAFRVWSAACSSGEEPYSIAMLLDDELGTAPWEVVGTDISTRVLESCRRGRYPLERAQHIPQAYLKTYCLKGVGPEDGFLLVEKHLRQKIHFLHGNLNGRLPNVGQFDVVFLRNVMIYFDGDTKRKLIQRLLSHIVPGGWLFIGHSETLNGINDQVRQMKPAIYQKPR
jgi:chemotaxis protein methyltransferase CheR